MRVIRVVRKDGRLRAAACAACVGLLGVRFAPAGAVVRDGSLGPGGAISRVNGDFAVPASAGRLAGPNLFHSFSRFDLDAGESATFSGPSSVHNVLARVTGGQPSGIDGTIRCTIPDANFYLVNPAGVVFGPDAALDVKGSFAVTTADVIKLSDGGRFAATAQPADSTLTTAAPAAFGFLGAAPQPVLIAGTPAHPSTLAVGPGKVLSIVGGTVALTGVTVRSDTGRVNVAAVAGPGDVTFDPSDPAAAVAVGAGQARGSVALQQASLNVPASTDPNADPRQAPPAGSVSVRAADLVLDRSAVAARNAGAASSAGPGVDIDLTGKLTLSRSAVTAATIGEGAGGNVTVRADEIVVDGAGSTAQEARIQASTVGPGRGGDLAITARAVTVKAGALVRAITGLSTGDAGSVAVTADSMVVDGAGAAAGVSTGISAGSQAGLVAGSAGGGGAIRLDVAHVTVDNGGVITTAAFGSRPGGDITVRATTMDLNHGAIVGASTIGGLTPPLGNGRAGNVDITATGAVTVSGGAQVQNLTLGPGDAGEIVLRAADLTLDRAGSDTPTGINAQSGATGLTGRTFGAGGNVTIQVNNLTLLNGAQVSATAFGAGAGGAISVTASDTVRLSGVHTAADGTVTNSGISASADGSDASGHGGDITLHAAHIQLVGGGQVAAQTIGPGNAGAITLAGGDVLMDAAGAGIATGVAATAGLPVDLGVAYGRGADVRVTGSSLTVRGGAAISADAYNGGTGGSIAVDVAGPVRVDGVYVDPAHAAERAGEAPSSISARTLGSGQGGSIAVRGTQVEVTDGGTIDASTLGTGAGGSVDVKASQSVTVRGTGPSLVPGDDGVPVPVAWSTLIAETLAGTADMRGGKGGPVSVSAPLLRVADGGFINATAQGSGDSGAVSVVARHVVLSGRSASSVSGIGAEARTADPNSPASGSDLTVSAGTLRILDGAAISSTTTGAGNGGRVIVRAARVVIDPQGFGRGVPVSNLTFDFNTGIAARSESPTGGASGDVDVRAGSMVIRRDGAVTATTRNPAAAGGRIRIVAGDLSLFHASSPAGAPPDSLDAAVNSAGITAASAGTGGNIDLTVAHQLYLRDSTINGLALGGGGQVVIDPPAVVLDGRSTINGLSGPNAAPVLVRIEGQFLKSPESRILTNAGIALPTADLSGAITALPVASTDAGVQLAPQCGLNTGGDVSSFVVTGRGAQPPQPGGWEPDFTMELRRAGNAGR